MLCLDSAPCDLRDFYPLRLRRAILFSVFWKEYLTTPLIVVSNFGPKCECQIFVTRVRSSCLPPRSSDSHVSTSEEAVFPG